MVSRRLKTSGETRRQIIADPYNDIFISIASLWEIAIKISLGKLTLTKPFADVIKQIVVENIAVLPIAPEHAPHVSALPFHHRDPFDRIIISQAQVENLPIMTADNEFAKYNIQTL